MYNSKTDIQSILNNDLRLAWSDGYECFSRKNAYFGIEFEGTILNDKTVIEAGLKGMSKRFLEPPVGFMGIKGITSLIKELSLWSNTYNSGMLAAIYKHFITFTGSVLPELPKELNEMNSGINNPHRGSRDLMAKALRTYASQYGNDNWKRASVLFEKSGNIINQISTHMVNDILNSYFTDTAKYVELFGVMLNYETEAFKNLLS
ncbi:DUF4872 domain-containing protein [Clostridium estertheticum]|uniref:DUF4872 domain-containing protein n=1 Tax=Clostridium estertheticum TaxID=238834 RepID=UPI00124E45F0|nr:DUF4872 domain-containing protein [Clostridium estertheticum]MBZ9618468.1 DUF4872 domain-containing protein [Clostridium estertheticum subsp. laramiense]WAG76296.1 DUF4872 domain-containing protein [Clostridium estertheticum]